jgi:hypothetical protein
MKTLEAIAQVLAGFTGVGALMIAYYAFRITRKQRNDSWFQSFNSLHELFWQDADFRLVRSCIANDASYAELESILRNRSQGRDQLSQSEYVHLERLDKFFNFLLRAREVSEELEGHRDLWQRIYFQYWLDSIVIAKRHQLWLYFNTHYKQNVPLLSLTVEPSLLRQFEAECAALQRDDA